MTLQINFVDKNFLGRGQKILLSFVQDGDTDLTPRVQFKWDGNSIGKFLTRSFDYEMESIKEFGHKFLQVDPQKIADSMPSNTLHTILMELSQCAYKMSR